MKIRRREKLAVVLNWSLWFKLIWEKYWVCIIQLLTAYLHRKWYIHSMLPLPVLAGQAGIRIKLIPCIDQSFSLLLILLEQYPHLLHRSRRGCYHPRFWTGSVRNISTCTRRGGTWGPGSSSQTWTRTGTRAWRSPPSWAWGRRSLRRPRPGSIYLSCKLACCWPFHLPCSKENYMEGF